MQAFDSVADAQQAGRKLLANIGIETAALDARLLLQAVTGLAPADMLLAPEHPLSAEERNHYIDLLVRRAKGEPVSRIMGMREFYGRAFRLSPFVLDPRPDTEALVDLVLSRHGVDTVQHVADLGVGSGAIIITLLAERPRWTGVAVDVSPEALAVALGNAEQLGVAARLTGLVGSWLEGSAERFDLIVSNPPYIPQEAIARLSREVRDHDPHLALDGGQDGLSCYRAIAGQAVAHLKPGGEVIVEIGAGQQADVTGIFEGCGFALAAQRSDLGGHVRALAFQQA